MLGGGTTTYHVARFLAARNHDITVITHDFAAAHARSAELVRLEGASHRLHDWLAGRASARRDLVSRLLPLLA